MSQQTDLLRILLADDDDSHAFTLQCAINRLSKPCAFLRVDNRELLARKIRSFEPELLVLAGNFASPGELRQIRQLTNSSPIFCLVKTPPEAEASLAAGAADCVLLSQAEDLGVCLERHLAGEKSEPHFRSGQTPATKNRLRQAEEKLEQLDRRLAAWLQHFGRDAQRKLRRLAGASRNAWSFAATVISKQYRRLKVQYLLRKQNRLVARPVPLESAPSSKIKTEQLRARESTPRAEPCAAAPEQRPLAAEESQALRTLELSFKTIFRTALDPMFLLDGVGSILHVNPAGCALLDLPASDLLGENLLNLVPADEKAAASAMWEGLLIEGQQKTDVVLRTASGERREVFVSARANLWFGVHLLVARDESEIKRLQREATALKALLAGTAAPHQTSTGPFGTGIAARCAEAGSMKEETSGAG